MTIGMDTKTAFRLGVRRLAILAAISLAFVWSISEVAFYFQKEDYERAPQGSHPQRHPESDAGEREMPHPVAHQR